MSELDIRTVQGRSALDTPESPEGDDDRTACIEAVLTSILLQVDRTLDVRSMTNAADRGAVVAVRFRGYSILASSAQGQSQKLLGIPDFPSHEFPADVRDHVRRQISFTAETVDENRFTWEGVTLDELERQARMSS